MPDYSDLISLLSEEGMQDWAGSLQNDLEDYFNNIKHGDYADWQEAIHLLPDIQTKHTQFDQAIVELGSVSECDEHQRQGIESSLRQLMPWRKGPFNFFGVDVDSEWRSDLKWERLQAALPSLENKRVLDIGCGNGYYLLRMLGQGARYVVGSDPTLRFLMQFEVVKHFLPKCPAWILPFPVQDLPHDKLHFDTVFSMGVIYHRRDPVEHLQQLHRSLVSGGQLLLEGLIIDEQGVNQYGDVLIPDKRYAKMNNVWTVPGISTLQTWLEESGFNNIQLVDVNTSSIEEQRSTEWMTFESLIDFLDPDDYSRTIEGYPAPKRAIISALK